MTYLQNHSLIYKAVLFGSHNEVVSIIFVIYNILEIYTSLLVQFFEKFLIEDEGHSADLLYPCLCFSSFVYEIGRYRYSQFAPKFFALETLQCISFAIGAD